MSIPEHSDMLNSDNDFVCPNSPESDDILSDLEEPHDVHKAEAGTQWSSIPPNSSCTYARNIICRPINKIKNANYHACIQIHFHIKVLSMSHSMGLAAPAYVHGLSMHLLVGQCQLGHTLTSVFTHSDHVSLHLHRFLVLGNEKLVIDLIHDWVADSGGPT